MLSQISTGVIQLDYQHEANKSSAPTLDDEKEEKPSNDDSEHPNITDCKFSPKGKYLSICTSDKFVLVWNISDWSVLLRK